MDKEAEPPKSAKSYAQVETYVAHSVRHKSGEPRLGADTVRRSITLGVRFRTEELAIVRLKAKLAGCSTNSFIRATSLGSDYQPPVDPELIKAILKLNRELTAQGNNLNQIAHHLNNGSSADEADSLLRLITRSLLQAHKAVYDALARGKEPEP